jgi:hypothetical protein
MSIVDDFNNSFGVQAVTASNAGSLGLPGEDTITAEVINRSREQSKERILALTGEQKVNLGVGELNTSLFDNDDNVIDLTDNKQTINTGADNDEITVSGHSNTINSEEGDDTIRLESGSTKGTRGNPVFFTGIGPGNVNSAGILAFRTGANYTGSTIDAGEGNDNISIDEITTTNGLVSLAGGEGSDTLSLAGSSEDYTITQNRNGSRTYIHNETGTKIEIAADIERITIGDETVEDSEGSRPWNPWMLNRNGRD